MVKLAMCDCCGSFTKIYAYYYEHKTDTDEESKKLCKTCATLIQEDLDRGSIKGQIFYPIAVPVKSPSRCAWVCPFCGRQCGGTKQHRGLHQCPVHSTVPASSFVSDN